MKSIEGKTVKGECPRGCGETLFLGKDGYVTCSYLHCPNPSAANVMLENSTDIVNQLRHMADVHHRTQQPSKLHFKSDPLDFTKCVALTCRDTNNLLVKF